MPEFHTNSGCSQTRCSGQDVRAGSHNLVIGRQNNYSSYGGHVVGYYNTISGSNSMVTGGNGLSEAVDDKLATPQHRSVRL